MWALSELNNKRVPNSTERFELKDVDLRYVPLRGSQLQDMDFFNDLPVGADMNTCDFTNTKFYSSFVFSANSMNAKLKGADFRDSRLDPSTNFSGAFVEGADVTESKSFKPDVTLTQITVNPMVIGKAVEGT